MKGMAAAFGSRRRYEGAQRLARLGRGPLAKAAVPGWTAMRDLPEPPKETFRDWWQHREPRPAPRATRSSAATCVSSAKDDILARVRDALGPSPAVPEIPRAYRAAGSLAHDGIVDLFCERVAEYQATVHRVAAADVAATVARSSPARARRRPAGFPDLGIDVIEDDDALDRRARHARRRRHRLRARDRRHRHDRPGLRPALRPPRAHAGPRPPRLHRRGARRSCPPCPTRSPGSPRPPPKAARSRSSPARRPPPTSSSTASKASTARACSTSSSRLSGLAPAYSTTVWPDVDRGGKNHRLVRRSRPAFLPLRLGPVTKREPPRRSVVGRAARRHAERVRDALELRRAAPAVPRSTTRIRLPSPRSVSMASACRSRGRRRVRSSRPSRRTGPGPVP